ncbi:MAG: uroporphyrinogen decarboxylase [Deltaproteobacteria bacterium]|nr:uroporphyrinogen decarboxylase [Deltaproteobacteria bacterium]
MQSRDRFLKAARCQNNDRPPVWLMRQAGRSLPEYRALREQHDFLEMLTTEKLITEISLQPWRRFHMDAVIVFADILLLPWKMGMDLQFIDGVGPKFSHLIESEEDLNKLKNIEPEKDLPFLLNALRMIRQETEKPLTPTLSHKGRGREDGNPALLGFAGSPWTVASYIMSDARDDSVVKQVLERLTEETIVYLNAQVEAGVDALQIFDSWGGNLSPQDYALWSAPYIKEIISALKPTGVPVILYVKESGPLLEQMVSTGCDVLSVGWETPLAEVKKFKKVIQGNLDPDILLKATPEEIRSATKKMLEEMQDYPGYIANLGHGVLPKTPVENIAAFVETVKTK